MIHASGAFQDIDMKYNILPFFAMQLSIGSNHERNKMPLPFNSPIKYSILITILVVLIVLIVPGCRAAITLLPSSESTMPRDQTPSFALSRQMLMEMYSWRIHPSLPDFLQVGLNPLLTSIFENTLCRLLYDRQHAPWSACIRDEELTKSM